jgi:hypothetical protein
MLKLKSTKSLDLDCATAMIMEGVFSMPRHEARQLIQNALVNYALYELENTERNIRAIFEKAEKQT